MPAVSRQGDSCTGHGCWPPRSGVASCQDVFVNNIKIHTVGDAWDPHTCPSIPETHGSSLATGWPTVFANNKPIGYIGAAIGCGGSIACGSPDVFVGENE